MNSGGHIRIFAGTTGRPFAERMCAFLDQELGNAEAIVFSDGNLMVRILEPIRDKDVYIVQPIGIDPNREFVELLFWIDAFKRSSANSITAIIPYFSYAKGDKKDEPRVSIRARVCAECLELEGVDRIITMDLHSAQVQGFFKKPLDHLYARTILVEYVKRWGIVDENLVVVSPDAGFAKRAHEFANALNCPVAIGDKTRTGHDENAKILEIIGHVEGKNCLIVDDFSISGGTICDIAFGLREKGANRIFACLSHLNLKEAGVKRIEASPIEMLISTDTVECEAAQKSSRIKLVSVAPLFAETAALIQKKEPLGQLFDHLPERILTASFGGFPSQIKMDLE